MWHTDAALKTNVPRQFANLSITRDVLPHTRCMPKPSSVSFPKTELRYVDSDARTPKNGGYKISAETVGRGSTLRAFLPWHIAWCHTAQDSALGTVGGVGGGTVGVRNVLQEEDGVWQTGWKKHTREEIRVLIGDAKSHANSNWVQIKYTHRKENIN